MTRRLWVVEMLHGKRWETTVGCGLSREGGRREMRDYWLKNNPDDRFRLVEYRPVTKVKPK